MRTKHQTRVQLGKNFVGNPPTHNGIELGKKYMLITLLRFSANLRHLFTSELTSQWMPFDKLTIVPSTICVQLPIILTMPLVNLASFDELAEGIMILTLKYVISIL